MSLFFLVYEEGYEINLLLTSSNLGIDLVWTITSWT